MGLLDFFRRKKSGATGPTFFDDGFMGTQYGQRWVNKKGNLPDPGAQAFAWETLQQAAFTPIGAGNLAIAMRSVPFGNGVPVMTQQGAIVNGVPTTAGQIYGQPLLNPITGQVDPYGPTRRNDVPQVERGIA